MSSDSKGPGRFSRVLGCRSMPPALNLNEFILARGPDVVGLYEECKPKYAEIPRNMRRRIRSYKPFFNRPKMPKTVGKQDGKLSRRTSRFKRLFLAEAVEKRRILPHTHLWHAKRFHMDELWNMRLPVRTACAGERCIWKAAKKGVVVHDRSYMDCWVGEDVLSILTKMKSTGHFTGCNFLDSRIVKGEYVACGMIKVGNRAISPFQVVCGGRFPICVWTHPSARKQSESLMLESGLHVDPKAARFELIGARAMDKLRRFLGEDAIVSTAQGKIQKYERVSVVVRDSGRLIDVFMDSVSAHDSWIKLIIDRTRPIGVLDRHSLMVALYCVPDFPFDFPSTSAGFEHAAKFSKKMLHADIARQPAMKLNASCVESSFFPDWRLVSNGLHVNEQSLATLRQVVIQPKSKGRVKTNAHVYHQAVLIGFVTTPISVDSGSSLASISDKVNIEECSEVTFKNPGSDHVYSATLHTCKWTSTDSVLLGTSRN